MNLNFLQFHEAFHHLGIFSVSQVFLMFPDFNSDNLVRWQKKGYIFRIRNKWYCFRDFTHVTGYHHLVANAIYSPSYISHQEALLFYGLIPEHIVDSVSVTTRKTMSYLFQGRTYKYYSISPDYFFGYELKEMNVNGIVRHFKMAGREKAILDFLYLYDFYHTEEEISEIRFNETVLATEVDWIRMDDYVKRFHNRALKRKIDLVKEVYNL